MFGEHLNYFSGGAEDPADHFGILTYTGNGSTQNVTGLNFTPDLVWIKRRDSGNYSTIFDVIRGPGYFVDTESTFNETFISNTLVAFISGGFSLQGAASANQNGGTYVAWCWKLANGSSANTAGTVSSTVSVNETTGTSVVTYTADSSGNTVGHGLPSAPHVVIFKNRTFDPVGVGLYTTKVDGSLDTFQTSGNFSITDSTTAVSLNASTLTLNGTRNNGGTGQFGDGMVALCFTEVDGFSKFGTYVGNGTSPGPVVNCGFSPRLVAIKRVDGNNDFNVIDAVRGGSRELTWNDTQIDAVATVLNFDTNGFSLFTTSPDYNTNGSTYLYMAFA